MRHMQNESKSCEAVQRGVTTQPHSAVGPPHTRLTPSVAPDADKAAAAADAVQRETALRQRLDLLQDDN